MFLHGGSSSSTHLLVRVGQRLVGRDDGLEAQVHVLHLADGVHRRHDQLQSGRGGRVTNNNPHTYEQFKEKRL